MPIAKANSLDLFYEEKGKPSDPALVLVMGLGAQMILWPQGFFTGLADRGFRVVRFDNRDIGLSTKIDKGPPVDVAAAFGRAQAGLPIGAPYTLTDMAEDVVGLLDAIGVERAHLVGASMGGMIAQIVAAEHPKRVRSLTSIMSTSGDPSLPPGDPKAMAALTAPPPPPEDREANIVFGMKLRRAIGSPGFPTPDAELRALVAENLERSTYPEGPQRQLLAVLADGSRVERLKKIGAPTLVIHGADDPLLPAESGKDTARHIRGARLLIEPGMGHDLPTALIPTLVDAIAAHCKAADA